MIRLRLIKGNCQYTEEHCLELEGFQVSGHAGYDRHGQDIVCAAASFLAITTVNSLEAQLGTAGEVTSRDGFLSCRLPRDLSRAQWQTAQIILRTLALGFESLQEEYPHNVSVEYVKVKGGAWKC